MNALDYILDGLEKALSLERELGVKTVECDRSLLAAGKQIPRVSPAVCASGRPAVLAAESVCAPKAGSIRSEEARKFDFVFLHDRPLSPKGSEMMSKITAAMKRTAETAPVVTDVPAPPAGIYVVLGGNALKKFFPGMRGAPGQWLRSDDGRELLVTNSPEYILRFGEVTPAVRKIKEEMWKSLKTVLQRLAD